MDFPSFYQTEQYKIRNESTFYGDHLKIILYPNYSILSWKISLRTQRILSNLLNEDFNDLLLRMNIISHINQHRFEDIYLREPSGTLSLYFLKNGIFDFELVVSNSLNENITIKKIQVYSHCHRVNELTEELINRGKEAPKWLYNFSGYTFYE